MPSKTEECAVGTGEKIAEETAVGGAVEIAAVTDVAAAGGEGDGPSWAGLLPEAHAAVSPTAMTEQINTRVRVAFSPFVGFGSWGWVIASVYTKRADVL